MRGWWWGVGGQGARRLEKESILSLLAVDRVLIVAPVSFKALQKQRKCENTPFVATKAVVPTRHQNRDLTD